MKVRLNVVLAGFAASMGAVNIYVGHYHDNVKQGRFGLIVLAVMLVLMKLHAAEEEA